MKALIGFTLALGLWSCSGPDYCTRVEECVKEVGGSYNDSECQADQRMEWEKASKAGCSAEYEETVKCLNKLTCEQLGSSTEIFSRCGVEYQTYDQCL